MSKRFSGTPDDIAALKLDKKRVSKDDICAHLGLSYYENNPDMLRADVRDFTSSDLGSVRNKEQEAGLLPDKTNVLKHNPDLKERFYLFGDSLSN
ncbi:MAG: hypothetical protein NTY95_12470, partial [Bacteroidia bacterium]|nr:hypothetical protein [Bacteroidia bacterium]